MLLLLLLLLSFGRHAYRLMSADMSTESRPTHRPSIGRYIGRVSVAISPADSIDRYSVHRCLKVAQNSFQRLYLDGSF